MTLKLKVKNETAVASVNLDQKSWDYLNWLAQQTKTNRSYIVNCLIRELQDSIKREKKRDKSFDEKKILFTFTEAFQREGKSNTNTIKKLKPRAA
jgi:hypothetical protein